MQLVHLNTSHRSVGTTVTSLQEGLGFSSQVEWSGHFLYGIYMCSRCMRGYPLRAPGFLTQSKDTSVCSRDLLTLRVGPSIIRLQTQSSTLNVQCIPEQNYLFWLDLFILLIIVYYYYFRIIVVIYTLRFNSISDLCIYISPFWIKTLYWFNL